MSERIHALAYQLFGKSSIDDCDLQDIRSMTERYPYFAPARFLLLEKLKRENHQDFSQQLQKAVLYYHNPLEFEQFISSDRFYTDVELDKETVVEPEPVISISKRPSYFEESADETETEAEFTEAEVKDEDVAIAEDILESETEWTHVEQEESHSSPAKTTNESAFQNTSTWNEPETTSSISEPEKTISDPATEVISSSFEKEDETADDPEKEEEMDTDTLPAPSFNPRLFQQQTAQEPQPLTFEPYHTVDYFASQGIRLSKEEAGKDKFGKQLKSFTEWLKTMKKLPAPQGATDLEGPTDQKVVHLAEDSVHDADIVTEAMAEVWIKQGKPEKALEVYKKLSLLNPSKNDYFAAKIDLLKLS